MSGQLLHNFLGLQVPNVNLIIFTARYNPLATSDGEVGEDAIFLVFVPGVRLQTLALGVVPELEGVVESGRKDILAVGRELDKRHRRVVIVDQRFQALA